MEGGSGPSTGRAGHKGELPLVHGQRKQSLPKKGRPGSKGHVEPNNSDFESDDEDLAGQFVGRSNILGRDWDLQTRVSALTDENQSLKQQIEESNEQAADLADALLNLQEEMKLAEAGPSSANVSKDLAKKNRVLTLQLQKERSRSDRLDALCKQYRKELEAFAREKEESSNEVSHALSSSRAVKKMQQHIQRENARAGNKKSQANEEEEEVDRTDYREMTRVLNGRLAKALSKESELKNQMNKLSRALQKEVGEDVPLERVLDEQGRWRGRAQEISLLKAKVRDLKKAAALNANDEGAVRGSSSSPKTSMFDRQALKIQEIQESSRQEYDRLCAEHETTVYEMTIIKKKFDSNKARLKVLENDNKDLRSKIKLLLSKSENDDKLVDGLKAEVEQAKHKVASIVKEQSVKRGNANKGREEAALLKSQLAREEQENSRIINNLREELRRAHAMKGAQFSALADEWNKEEKEHQYTLAVVELEKKQELLDLYIDREKENDAASRELARKNVALTKKLTALEKRLENRTSSQKGLKTKQQKEAETVAVLKEDLEFYKKEVEEQKEIFQNSLRAKDAELHRTHYMAHEVKQSYSRSLAELRQQFADIVDSFRHDSSSSSFQTGLSSGRNQSKSGNNSSRASRPTSTRSRASNSSSRPSSTRSARN